MLLVAFTDQFAAGVALAAALSNHLITLSTGILALSVTFAKDVAKVIERKDIRILSGGWIFYLVTILFALAHISALTGALIPIDMKDSLNLRTARIFGLCQIIAFGIGTSFMIWFGVRVLRAGRRPA